MSLKFILQIFKNNVSFSIKGTLIWGNSKKIIIIDILDYQLFDDDICYRYLYYLLYYLYKNEMNFYEGNFYHNINGKIVWWRSKYS